MTALAAPAMDLGPALEDIAPEPDIVRLMEERDELMRQAAQRYVDQVAAGRPADKDHLAWAQHTVQRIKPLNRPLGTGEPKT
jgi:hypothetical protein